MAYLLAAPVVLFLLVIGFGALSGRIRVSSCCAPADPRRDLRMRSAFEATVKPAGGASGAMPHEGLD